VSHATDKLHKIHIRNLSVLISRITDRDTGSTRYVVRPRRWSKEGDDPWSETADSLDFQSLLTTATELLRRADDLPIAGAEQERRAEDLRTMAALLRQAQEWISARQQAIANYRQEAALPMG
jgi:hypothetical protein